jgi:CRISPR-associated endonuclease/helicase Cas3
MLSTTAIAPPKLSKHAQILWGKSGDENSDLWLPLFVHLEDTAEIAAILWDEWVTPGVKQVIIDGLLGLPPETSKLQRETLALCLLILLALLHDTGKATPFFQLAHTSRFRDDNVEQLVKRLKEAGLECAVSNDQEHSHALVSFTILKRNGWNDSMAVVVGSHHGKPPTYGEVVRKIDSWKDQTNCSYNEKWLEVQDELVAWAQQRIAADMLEQIKSLCLSECAQVLLTGLIIMADWIASDQKLFPLVHANECYDFPKERAYKAWMNLDLAPYQEISILNRQISIDDLYRLRFSLNVLRPIQREIGNLLTDLSQPGIVIIEAPMGEGKTEAALVAAEILAKQTGRSGVFFALPTQATSDGIFERILRWVDKLGGARTITLVHGKAHLNETFQALKLGLADVNDGNDTVIVSDWAYGRKKAILSDFAVGTIDHILMVGLKQRHLMLRHLGLANKVIILDECHAYDAYMNSYLRKALSWLGAYKVPVVMLSATLPPDRRQELTNAYLNITAPRVVDDPLFLSSKVAKSQFEHETAAYPLVTYSSGKQLLSATPPTAGRKLTVKIKRLSDDAIHRRVGEALKEGGCVGIIMNTVKRAQQFASELSEEFGKEYVTLIHAQFIAPDRAYKEAQLYRQLGPDKDHISINRPHKLIVVGTQVLEQSLDIDFDILITDICPMDLLIQRIGRLHRHGWRFRPALLAEPHCYVTGIDGDRHFDRGSELVYGSYLLMNTQALLPEQIDLPEDIPRLVQAAYSSDGIETAVVTRPDYRQAKEDHEESLKAAAQKAGVFQVGSPETAMGSIIDWLNTDVAKDPSGKRAEATVRDTGDSIQVLVIREKQPGGFYTLPWLPDYADHLLPESFTSNEDLAQAIASSFVNLPASMCMPWKTDGEWMVDHVITELERDCCEKLPTAWQQSRWLKGELFLILDREYNAELAGFRLHYNREYGLQVERMGAYG